MIQIFKNTNINFIKRRKIAYIFSAILFLSGAVSLVLLWNSRQGIDFTGGTIVRLNITAGELNTAQVRSVVSGMGIGRSIIQETKSDDGKGIIIRLPLVEETPAVETEVSPVDSALIKFVEEYGRSDVTMAVFIKEDPSADIKELTDEYLLELKGYSLLDEDTLFLIAGDFSTEYTGLTRQVGFDSYIQLSSPLEPSEKTLDRLKGRGVETAIVFTDLAGPSLSVRVFVDSSSWINLEEQAYPKVEIQEQSPGIDVLIEEAIEENYPGVTVEVTGSEHVGARLSKNLKVRTLWVVLLGVAVILGYVSIRFTYRFGVASVIALIHDVIITAGIYALAGFEFNMSTIAALLTLIGYSINDSIIVSDRIREINKMNKGKDFSEIVNQSVNATLSRTVITTTTTFLVLLVLFIFGSSIIKDFAFVLMMGVIIGTYSSIFVVSSLVVDWEKRFPTPLGKSRA
ncbi:protein translocase subunit SecF [candidate division WOR-3 bacterium]|nr:protein translocase subunit SecF [candidate division WOR-3 bacterium]